MHPASSPKHWCYSNFLKRCQHNYLWQILRIMLQPQLIWNRNDKRVIPYPYGIYKRKIRETFEQSVVWVSSICDICHPTGHQGWFSTSDCRGCSYPPSLPHIYFFKSCMFIYIGQHSIVQNYSSTEVIGTSPVGRFKQGFYPVYFKGYL